MTLGPLCAARRLSLLALVVTSTACRSPRTPPTELGPFSWPRRSLWLLVLVLVGAAFCSSWPSG